MSAIVVLDVGKTLAKLSLWEDGVLIDRRTRPNTCCAAAYPCLDIAGIERFLAQTLADFARQRPMDAIIPVAHGAGAVLIAADGSYLDPLDYEAPLPESLAQSYAAQRPAFAETGSPLLPCGLNLGAQLHWLEALAPERFAASTILPWAQFWAWRLSGVAATEVSSLGVHTDLWNPAMAQPSSLAVARGWDKQFAPLRRAGAVLGKVTQEWVERAGLPPDCKVYCGLHDSNADLLAARAHPVAGGGDLTVVSTGTWFIAMRSGADKVTLPEGRDCLLNADVFARPVPSARFMGGRETELLEEVKPQLDPAAHAETLLARADDFLGDNTMALPAFQPGVGPFPTQRGRWIARPQDPVGRRAAAGLYLALMLDCCLDLIGTRQTVVIGGRFQADPVFTRTLAALRPQDAIFLTPSGDSLCHGALSLIDATQIPATPMTRVAPLDGAIQAYRRGWRDLVRAGG